MRVMVPERRTACWWWAEQLVANRKWNTWCAEIAFRMRRVQSDVKSSTKLGRNQAVTSRSILVTFYGKTIFASMKWYGSCASEISHDLQDSRLNNLTPPSSHNDNCESQQHMSTQVKLTTTGSLKDFRPVARSGFLCCELLPRYHGNRTPKANELERRRPESYQKYWRVAFHHHRYRLWATCRWFSNMSPSRIVRSDQAPTYRVRLSWKGTTGLSYHQTSANYWLESLRRENTRSRACAVLQQIWTIVYCSSSCRSRYKPHRIESAVITGKNYLYKWGCAGLSPIRPSFHNLVIIWLKTAMVQGWWDGISSDVINCRLLGRSCWSW